MKATKLYSILEKDFITSNMSDNWFEYMGSISEFVCDNFKKRSMGLVCDFTKEINKVYTAVFPSEDVMKKIITDDVTKAMLFVHHPSIWDIRKAPDIFYQMDKKLLQEFKKRNISIYNLHVPLDHFGKYSTSVTLAKALNIKPEKPFAPYFGALCGVFGKSSFDNITDLKNKLEEVVGHKVKLYKYGDDKIKDNKVALIAGGGNDLDMLKEISNENVNTFITGITIKNDFSKKEHSFSKKHKINILGGTHYSTEKFACKEMVKYFKKQGLESEFIDDDPLMEDM
ncbi:Nif3-like dinuclear metal center hexameric protein [Candidatus Woesearchaeota archaeon]|nr:Nif3-like dinuclear metal center hexameric protein [Candidatus Woesearchaeota archaeon]